MWLPIVITSTPCDIISLKILDKDKALNLASGLSVKKLFKNIDILIDAQANYRKVNNPQEFFTLAALKICENNNTQTSEVIYKEVDNIINDGIRIC